MKRSAAPESSILLCWPAVVGVLEDLMGRYFTPHQTHEALALKFHLLACCIRRAGMFYSETAQKSSIQRNQDHDQGSNKSVEPLRDLIKDFLRGTDPHGLPLGEFDLT